MGGPDSCGTRVSRFLKLRLTTLVWGFLVSLIFTGSLITSAAMWTVVVAGNTVLMWRYGR
jgi:hypothetical protein